MGIYPSPYKFCILEGLHTRIIPSLVRVLIGEYKSNELYCAVSVKTITCLCPELKLMSKQIIYK